MKVGIKLGKVKKFGIGWCIPHRVVADNAKGGSCEPPPPQRYGLNLHPKVTQPPMNEFQAIQNVF
jgi:hypothetical protein